MLSTDISAALSVTGRQRAILAFNKANGIWLNAMSWSDPTKLGGQEFTTFVEAEFDLWNDKVLGTYPDFQIVDRTEAPKEIFESQLDTIMSAKITSEYPLAEQVNILGRSINILAAEHGIELPELTELLSYISLCKQNNKISKEFYSVSPDYVYISNEQKADDESARYEGGLHEALGARVISGGRVFAS